MQGELYEITTYVNILCWCTVFSVSNLYIKFKMGLNRYSTRVFFIIHALANFLICCLTYNDMLYTLVNPLNSCICDPEHFENCSSPALFVMCGLHMSHIVTDFLTLTYIDWMHHLLSVFLSVYFLLYYTIGPVKNFAMFFACGLPGGIDYLLLYFVKKRWITKLYEKKINSFLNMWIRLPMLMYLSSVIWINWISGNWVKNENNENEMPFWVLVSFIVFIGCNSIYFAERVVSNYGSSKLNPDSCNKLKESKSEIFNISQHN